MENKLLPLLIVLLMTNVAIAHTESVTDQPEQNQDGFDFFDFLLVIFIVSLVVAIGLLLLKRIETIPGTFPIRKLAIAAAITIIINATLLGYVYREVIF